MTEKVFTTAGVRAGDVTIGTPFKRGSPNSNGYTITRVEPENGNHVGEGYILGLNCFADCLVYDIKQDEIVYPITNENRTAW